MGTPILWTILVLASVLGQESNQVRDPWAGSGELSIYWSETQIGTIAKRELRNEAGQVTKTIYYVLSIGSPARAHWPLRRDEITEDMLVPEILEEKAYDEAGRLRWERREGAAMTEELIAYDSAGKKSHTFLTRRTLRGDDYYQTDYLPDGRKRTIQSDTFGRPLGSEGDLPDDLAQAFEWGEPSGDFAFSLSASPLRGRQECIRFVLTIRNLRERERETPLETWPDIELRDSRGRIVPQPPRTQAQRQRAASLHGQCGESSVSLRPHGAYTVQDVDLSDLYEGLTPGAYSVVVRHCVGANARLAVSNTVRFTVVK